MGAGQAHGSSASHVDGSARADASRDCAVVPRGENIRKQRQVADFRHSLGRVGEPEEVEIGVGDHHIFGLAADPAAHIHIAVGSAGPGRVHIQADASLALFAVAAAAAGNVEGHRHDIAHADKLHIPPGLDHLAGDLVAQNQPLRRRRSSPHHVLIRATDVCGDYLQNHAMFTFARAESQFGVVDGAYFDNPRLDVRKASVACHWVPPDDWAVEFEL
jgi:hypothetical protein